MDVDTALREGSVREVSPQKKSRKRSNEGELLPLPIRNDEDDFFCNSVACTLRKLSRLHNIKAKVEIFKVLETFIEQEEAPKA